MGASRAGVRYRRFAADQTLFNFDGATDLAQVAKTDATVAAVKAGSGMAMRVSTGTNLPWPGVTLPAPDGNWDLSPFAQVVMKVKNAGTKRGTLNCRVDNPGADGTKNCVNGSLMPNPSQSDMLRVTLRRASDDKLGGKLFGLRGYPVAAGRSKCSSRRSSRHSSWPTFWATRPTPSADRCGRRC